MSLWTDAKVKELVSKVADLEDRLTALERRNDAPQHENTVDVTLVPLKEPPDRRTREWKIWKMANS